MTPASVLSARLKLAALWLSQVARFLADYCLRIFVVFSLSSLGPAQRDSAFHLVVALFMLPSIVLVPIYGALGNSLPKRWVLVGSAGWCLLTASLFTWLGGDLLLCVAVLALGVALYNPTRFAILPAAAEDTRWPLARVTAAVEIGAVLAIVVGMILGGTLFLTSWADLGGWLGQPADLWASPVPVAMVAVVLLNVVCFVLALPAGFPSDVRRPETALQALAGFFRDTARIWRHLPTRWSLSAIAGLRGLVTGASGAVVAITFRGLPSEEQPLALLHVALFSMVGMALGSFLAGLQKDIRKAQVLVPIGATGLGLMLAWAAAFPGIPWWLLVLVGTCGGLVNVPLLSGFQLELPADARGNGMAVLNTAGFLAQAVMSATLGGLARAGILSAGGQMCLVAVLTLLGALTAWGVEVYTPGRLAKFHPEEDQNAQQ